MRRFDEFLKKDILKTPSNQYIESLLDKLYSDHETFIINQLKTSKQNLKTKINTTFIYYSKNDCKNLVEGLRTKIQNKLSEIKSLNYGYDAILQAYLVNIKDYTYENEKIILTIKTIEKDVDDLINIISQGIKDWQTQIKTSINELENKIQEQLNKSNTKNLQMTDSLTNPEKNKNNQINITESSTSSYKYDNIQFSTIAMPNFNAESITVQNISLINNQTDVEVLRIRKKPQNQEKDPSSKEQIKYKEEILASQIKPTYTQFVQKRLEEVDKGYSHNPTTSQSSSQKDIVQHALSNKTSNPNVEQLCLRNINNTNKQINNLDNIHPKSYQNPTADKDPIRSITKSSPTPETDNLPKQQTDNAQFKCCQFLTVDKDPLRSITITKPSPTPIADILPKEQIKPQEEVISTQKLPTSNINNQGNLVSNIGLGNQNNEFLRKREKGKFNIISIEETNNYDAQSVSNNEKINVNTNIPHQNDTQNKTKFDTCVKVSKRKSTPYPMKDWISPNFLEENKQNKKNDPFKVPKNEIKRDTYFNNPKNIYSKEPISQRKIMIISEKNQIDIKNDTKSLLLSLPSSDSENLKSYYYDNDNTKLDANIIKLYIDQLNIELDKKPKKPQIFLVAYGDLEKEIGRIVINRTSAKLTETHILIYDLADAFFLLIQLRNNDLNVVNPTGFLFARKIDSIVSCLPNFNRSDIIKSSSFKEFEIICDLIEKYILLNIEDSVLPIQTQATLHNNIREKLALCMENNLLKESNILPIKK